MSILNPLALRKFFSLDDANQAIRLKLEELNTRPLSALPSQSRQSRFETIERNLLNPLPTPEYLPDSWIVDRKVSPNNQIRLANARYSVPWGHAGEMLRVIGNKRTGKLSFFLLASGEHLCDSVLRNAAEASEGTKKEHLPSKLQYMLENKSELLTRIGLTLGDIALTLAMGIAKPNNSMAIRHLHGVMAKAKRFEKEDFDDICLSVIEQQPITYQAFVKACNKAEIEGKVKKTSTRKPKVARSKATRIKDLRGADYFKQEKDGL